ncbi:alpha/beta fold hydrolase [Sphingomonas panacisoli]|uniref:Alpha/beta fold hydrolase n=1 Tax=Sphingomonas panacisoli TaxID=1813879 RepID=A0A5B8LGP2_9SPHN|nr:alpha/beta fold hydrolase [Sphingomonas panacisoli]QDZ07066.1 alpha/beta fold hydrolase [Sphingomonas panacisoli]
MIRTLACAAMLGLGVAGALHAQTIPNAVIADPAPDAQFPAKLIQLRYTSAGIALPARLFLASGGKPHPTVLMLHGFPGTEMNFDLDRAMQRAGWHVLAIEYRGVWGGGGKFSFSHVVEDGRAGLAWLRDPANDAKYFIDPTRIVVMGHSMGGFATVMLSDDKQVAGSVVISGANIGGRLAGAAGKPIDALRKDWGEDASYTNMTIEEMVADGAANAARWDWRTNAARFAGRPLLLLSSNDGLKPDADLAAAEVKKAGGTVTEIKLETDHSYNDHRIALAAAIVGWLQATFR